MKKEGPRNREAPDLKVHAPTIKTIADLEKFERGTVVREEGETDEEYRLACEEVAAVHAVIRRNLEDPRK